MSEQVGTPSEYRVLPNGAYSNRLDGEDLSTYEYDVVGVESGSFVTVYSAVARARVVPFDTVIENDTYSRVDITTAKKPSTRLTGYELPSLETEGHIKAVRRLAEIALSV